MHPRAALNYLRWRMSNEDRALTDFVTDLLGSDPNSVTMILSEVKSTEFEIDLRDRLKDVRYSGKLTFQNGRLLYIITRLMRPRVVVETGVFAGGSTAYILNALEENGAGKLFSIDRKDPFLLKIGREPGFAIDEELRDNWHLILGRSSEKLQPLLDCLNSLDFFFHDSDHSYENMLYEFQTIWPFLSSGGLLLSDNIDMNSSFDDFCGTRGVRPIKTRSSFTKYGAAMKSHSSDCRF